MGKIIKHCKTCKYWKNQQAELEYSKFNGICTCYKWKFTIHNGGDIKLLDRGNINKEKHMGIQRLESQSDIIPIGSVDKSRYCFVTGEEFGCIYYKINKPQ